MTLLDDEYKALYSGYYQPGSSLEHKRNLSAESTLDHIRAVVGQRCWDRLIDVGAGNGSVLAKIDEVGSANELYAVEVSETGVSAIEALALPHLKEAKLFDGYRIPYPDKYFDVALCIHVLEHVEHERLFLKELARVSKELILEVPLEGGLKISKSIRQTAQYGHVNHYTVPGFLYLLRTVGIEPVSYSVVTSSADYERHLYGKWRGSIKNLLRRALLASFPSMAPWLLAYLFTVHCKPVDK